MLEKMMPINLMIQIQGDEYFPAVKSNHKADFAYVGQLAITAPKPVENTKEQGENLSDIKNLIAEDNKQLLQSFKQSRKAILSMAMDMDKEDDKLSTRLLLQRLMELYIKYLPQSNNTLSVSALEQSKGKTVIVEAPQKQEQETIELLANALSDWITTKQVDPDSIFDELEKQSTVGLSFK